MARKKLIETEAPATKDSRSENLSKLHVLVDRWGKNKKVLDPLKKDVDKDAAEIKQLMLEEKLDTSISGEFTAVLSFTNKESIDEDGLLDYIKSVLWGTKGSMQCPYIKTVEVIDWEAVEKALYNGEITKEQAIEMDKFKTVTKTPVLKMGKPKKGE